VETRPFTLRELVLYFLRLGSFGFGGPIALVGYMQRDLVEVRRWISPQDYGEGLALAQLAPGPLAAQLAIYLGWLRGGTFGATLVAVAFIAPSFVAVLALSALYLAYGGLPWMQGVFYGIGAAVIAIIARGALKLSRSTLHRDAVLWGVCAVNAVATIMTEREVVWVFLASGVFVMLARGGLSRRAADASSAAGALLPLWGPWASFALPSSGAGATLTQLGVYFASAGMFVFGSGLAIVPFLRGGVVEQHHWLTDTQFLDAVAVAMITPGPVVITVAFIGYLVAGLSGATVAAAAVFVPCWLVTIVLAPFYSRLATNRTLAAFVSGVTAAACGALIGAVVVLGRRAIYDVPTALVALAAGVVLWRMRRVPEPALIACAGAAGLVLRATVRG
jgi:chromate transporter